MKLTFSFCVTVCINKNYFTTTELVVGAHHRLKLSEEIKVNVAFFLSFLLIIDLFH